MSQEELQLIISAKDEAGKIMNEVSNDVAKLDKDVKETSKSFGLLEKAGGILGNALTGVVLGGVVAVSGALLGLGGSAIDVAGQVNQAQREIQGELGVTAEEAENLADISKSVFANNFADSVIEAKDTVVLFQQQLSKLGPVFEDTLGKVTEDAFRIRDAFGAEIPETVNAVTALVKNFGITAEEATSLIADGFQNGLNSSDDFLESITEYSNQFAEGGANVDQFFNTLSSGLSTGVLGTDKAGDLFKEFVVRIQDGSKLTAESLEMIGLNSDKILSDLASGTIEPIDAFNEVQKALKNVDSEAIQMQAGVGLLGTQFEDLGASAVLAIDTMGDEFDKSGKSLDSINVRYENFADLAQGAWRQALVALEPLSQKVLEFASQLLPYLIEGLEWLTDTLTNVGENPAFQQFVQETWQGIINSFQYFSSTILPILVSKFNEFMVFFQNEFLPLIQAVWSQISTQILPQIIPIVNEVIVIMQALWPVIQFVLVSTWNIFKLVIPAVITILSGFIAYMGGWIQIISGILTGDMSKIVEGFGKVFGGIGQIVKGVFDGVVAYIRQSLNSTIDIFNNLVSNIPELPGIGKPAKIPRFAKGGDFTTDGPMLMMVGDNSGGKERVQVTPLSSPNIDGPQANGQSVKDIVINMVFDGNAPIFMDSKTVREFIRVIKPELQKELKL